MELMAPRPGTSSSNSPTSEDNVLSEWVARRDRLQSSNVVDSQWEMVDVEVTMLADWTCNGQTQSWSDIHMSRLSSLTWLGKAWWNIHMSRLSSLTWLGVREGMMVKSGHSQAGQFISSWPMSIYHAKNIKLQTSTSRSCKWRNIFQSFWLILCFSIRDLHWIQKY